MLKNKITQIVLVSSCLLMFSCNDLKKISNQIETVKGNQDIIIAKQKEFNQKLAALQSSVKSINVSSNAKPADKKPAQKRKNPNPDFVHDIPIGGSVVMGNPNAKVTITEFTDFQ